MFLWILVFVCICCIVSVRHCVYPKSNIVSSILPECFYHLYHWLRDTFIHILESRLSLSIYHYMNVYEPNNLSSNTYFFSFSFFHLLLLDHNKQLDRNIWSLNLLLLNQILQPCWWLQIGYQQQSTIPGMVPAYKRFAMGDISKGGVPVYQQQFAMSPLQHTSLMQLQQPQSYIPMSCE